MAAGGAGGGGHGGRTTRAPRRRRRWGRGVLIWLVALGALGAVALAATAAWLEGRKDELAAEASARLGRPVTIGALDIAPFGAAVTVRDLVVGPGPGEGEAPALTLRRAHLDVALLRTLLSLGHRAGIEEIAVEGLAATVVRLADGTLSWQRIADRLAGAPKEEAPPDPDLVARIRGARLAALRVADARVRFVEVARPEAPIEISRINLSVEDASLRWPFDVRLSAAVLAAKENLKMDARVGRAPAVADRIVPPPVRRLALQMARTDLAPLAPYLAAVDRSGGLLSRFRGAIATADLRAEVGAALAGGTGRTRAQGELRLEETRFVGGAPFEARLTSDLDGDAERGDWVIRALSVALAEMRLDARGELLALRRAPRFRGFRVTSSGLDFDALDRHLPGLVAGAGLEAHGPFSFAASGDETARGPQLRAELDLTPARLEAAGRFAKPAGVALRLTAAGRGDGDGIVADRIALDVAGWRLVARGTLRDLQGAAPRFELAVDTEQPGTAGIVRLLPADLVRAGSARRLAGTVKVRGTASGTAKALRAHGEAQVDVPALALRGGGQANLEGRGESRHLDATFDLQPFALRPVAALAPTVDLATIPDVRFGGRGRLRGALGAPSTMQVELPAFSLAGGRSQLRGSARLANLDRPQIELDARADYLDLDDFLPTPARGGKAAAKPGAGEADGRRGATPVDPRLAAARGRAQLAVKQGRAAGVPYEGLRGDFTLDGGRLVARTLEVSAFGGRFSGSGTELPLPGLPGRILARGKLEGLDVDALVGHFGGGGGGLLAGRLSGAVDVSAAGASPAEIARSLAGTLGGQIAEARFLPTGLLEGIAAPLAAQVPIAPLRKAIAGADEKLARVRDKRIGTLRGRVRFDGGRLLVAEPLEARTPQGPLTVRGAVGLDGQADLVAAIELAPEAASALAANQVAIARPLPVELAVTGPLRSPRIAPTGLDRLARTYATAWAESGAANLLGARGGEAARRLLGSRGAGPADGAAARAGGEVEAARGTAAAEAAAAARKAREAAGRRIRRMLGR